MESVSVLETYDCTFPMGLSGDCDLFVWLVELMLYVPFDSRDVAYF